MAVTIDDFAKIWASTSPLTPYEFTEDNYQSGWNFVGNTPPSRQMWDFLQKQNDEKAKYIVDNFLPLSGGTMTGTITVTTGTAINKSETTGYVQIVGGTSASDGASITLRGKDDSSGYFTITAHDGNDRKLLNGKPDGSLKWDDKEVERVNASGSNYIRYENGLQICWGSVSGSGDSSGTTVTFPVAFSSAPSVTATANSLTATTNHVSVQVSATATSCSVAVSVNATWSSATVVARYIAVGFWK